MFDNDKKMCFVCDNDKRSCIDSPKSVDQKKKFSQMFSKK